MGRSGQWGIKGSMLPLPFVYEGARPAAAGARGRIHAGGMTMKRRSWGVLAALVLTLLLLTTGALAAGHTDHALCTHTGSSCKCPESAKSKAFTDAKALTYKSSVQNGNTYYNLCINGVELESNYNGAIEYFILPAGNYYLAEDVTLSYAIRIQSGETVNLCLNGHSITKIADDENVIDGVISVDDGATFTLCDCQGSGKITHANGKIGRGVRCGGNKGTPTFIMYSGEISGNHAGTSSVGQDGAGVEMQGGKFTMYGGKITDNKVQYESNYGGGGVCLHTGANFTMYDGEISSNTSADGGGVFAIGGASFVMQGGTISNNEANGCGGGLALYNNGTFELSGGTIGGTGTNDANTAKYGGGVYGRNIPLTISDSVKIKNNNAEYGGGVYVNSGNINMTGGLITGNEANKTLVVGTVNASGGGVYVNGGTFTMSNTASITDNSVGDNGTGGGVYVGGGSFTMNGGEISRNTTDVNNGGAGGVCLNGGSFIMRSGSITGNTAGNGGGGVDAAAGTFTMTGGSITGNTASYGEGGGIYARIPLNMSGTPVIKDNTVGGSANNVYLTSSQLPITLTGALDEDAEIYVTPDGTPPVNVAVKDNYTIIDDDAARFHADDTSGGYEFAVINNGYYIEMRVKPHTHKVCADSTCTDDSHGEVEFNVWSKDTELPDSTGNWHLTTDVTLDETWKPADGTVLDLNGHSITMEAEGEVINVTGTFTLTDCKGGKADYGKITHKADVKGRGVYVWKEGGSAIFTMYGGEISGNAAGSGNNGGGVYVGDPYTTFIMLGGIITENSAGFGGGGVYVGGGKFELSGDAVITKNTANHGSGGGVYMNGSSTPNSLNSFTMSGNAMIAENTATQTGGGVYMNSAPNFTMNGGNIYGNTATNNGGGVYMLSGTFTMNDGNIYNNTATENGGGVCVNGGTFTMTKGMIGSTETGKGNSAKEGGGVCINRGATFTMASGSISGNETGQSGYGGYGGGVCINSNATFTMNSGSISGNKTGRNGYGGGVYVGGTFTMTSGTIGGDINGQGNTATQGGGVYIGSNSTFRMVSASGAKIIGNKLNNSTLSKGGGVHVNGNFEIAGKVSIQNNNNSSMTESSNVYLPGDKTIRITGELTAGQKQIGITLASMPTTGPVTFADGSNYTLTENDAAAFYVDEDYSSSTYSIQLEDNRLLLYLGQPHKHKVCVGTDETGCSHPDLSFRELTYDTFTKKLQYVGNNSSNQISGSPLYLYLKNDIEIDETITITENSKVTLCLNGHSITSKANGDAIKLENGATLTLCDCRGGDKTAKYGKITHHSTGRGRGVTLGDGSTFTMYGGSITGNTLIEQNAEGAGVYVAQNATFAMHGGSITSNTLSGQDAKGGGIFADAGSSLSVSGNVQVTSNGSSNLYLNHNEYGTNYSFVPITVTGELADTAKIGVTLVKSQCPANTTGRVNIAKATTEGWIKADNFVSDYNFYQMGVATLSNEQLAQLRLHDHTWGVRVKSAAETNILERYCTAFTNCPSTGGTLTLTANDAGFTGSAYAGASVSTDSWDVSDADRTIFYTNAIGGAAIEAPTKAGTYYANVTVGGVTATKEFQISRATLTLNGDDFNVEVPNAPTYNGQPKTVTKAEFVSPDKAKWFGDISVKYLDEDGDEVTDPTNAGTYTVKLDVAAGDGYEAVSNISDTSWEFTILQDTQELSFGQTGTVEKVYGDGIFTITASHTKGDSRVSYESSDPSVATVAADGKVTIVGAGTTTITAKAAGTTNYQEATASYTLNVAQKEITVSGITAKNKYYDKTTGATLVYTNATLTGKVDGDELSVTATGTFETADAGEGKTVTIADLMLTGGKAGNYKLAATGQQATTTATINKMPLTIKSATGISDKDYDGNNKASIHDVSLWDINDSPVSGVGRLISAHFPDADADDANVDVTVTVTLSEDAAKNYELTSSTYTAVGAAKINKIAPTLPADLTGWRGNALSTVTLPDGWTWKDNTTVMSETGDKEFSAAYAGDTNHNAGDYTVTVTV